MLCFSVEVLANMGCCKLSPMLRIRQKATLQSARHIWSICNYIKTC